MSKQSDIFIQMEFKRKTYKNEILKALKSGDEKAINAEIRRVNKVLKDRLKKLEDKGLDKMSQGYRALKNVLGSVGGKPAILPPSAMSHDDKIAYLQGIKSVIDKRTMTIGGTREELASIRKSWPFIDRIYQKHGERYTAEVFDQILEIKDRISDDPKYQEVFDNHSNEIMEIIEKFHDKKSVVEFNEELDRLNLKVYNTTTVDFIAQSQNYMK